MWTSWRPRLVNIGHLLTGNVFSAIAGMLAFFLTARALGAADYGVLALVYSYVKAVELLLSCQTWQPLIKYGASALEHGRGDDYATLLKFGLIVDIVAGVLCFVAAFGVAWLFGPLLGIGPESLKLVLIFSTVLLLPVNGVPTAVLRLAGRFHLLVYGSLLGVLLRLAFCAAGLLNNWSLPSFVAIWAVTSLASAALLWAWTYREISDQRLLRASLKSLSSRFPGIWSFTVNSNIELALRSSTNEFDTLLVGLFVGPTGAGFYQMAKRLGRVALHVGVQVQAVLYPDVSRLWARGSGDEFRRTITQMRVVLLLIGLLLFACAVPLVRPLIVWGVGEQFLPAAELVLVQIIAVLLILFGSATRIGLFAMGGQASVLRSTVASTVVFHVAALSMVPFIGPVGGNWAHVAAAAVWLAGLHWAYRKRLSAAMDHAVSEASVASPGAIDRDLKSLA
jgi:O-antigen/teichoic acid export membrane protein